MCPNTSRFYGRVAKLQKLSPILESGICYLFRVRKRDSKFFAGSIGLRIETTDFYLIRARKMAQLVGLAAVNKSRTYREITVLAIGKVKAGARSTGRRNNFVGFIVRVSTPFCHDC